MQMRNKVTLLGMLAVLTLSVVIADTLVAVYVDGKKQDFVPAARVREGKAYAPLRAAAEAVGADVKWVEAQQMAVVCKKDRCVNIRKTEGIIVEGRLLIPVRLMAEALQAQVIWDSERKAVLINTKAPQANGPAPREILERMLAAYKGAQTYQSEGRYTINNIMPAVGMETTAAVGAKVTYETPNMVYAEYTARGSVKYICDGEHLYMAMGLSDRVPKAPAPSHLALLREALWVGLPVPMGLCQFMGLQLIDGKSDVNRIRAVQSGFDQTNEWLTSLQQPANTWVLTVTREVGPSVVLWIGRESYLVRQAAMEMSGEEIMTEFRTQLAQEEDAGHGGSMSAHSPDITMQMMMAWEMTVLNEPVPEGTFVYELPEGMQLVEVDSTQDMLEVLRSGVARFEGKSVAGQPPIDFIAKDLEGNTVKLSDFKGQPIVLDFWATWCPPCVRELPILEEIYTQLNAQGLQIVAVSSDFSIGEVKKHLQKHPVSFTVLWLDPRSEESSRVDEEYGITAIPRTLYIGSDWVVRADTTGLHPKKDILEAISRLGIDAGGAK